VGPKPLLGAWPGRGTLPPHSPRLPHSNQGERLRDEAYYRDYRAGRDALNDGLDRLFAAIGSAFRTFHDIQFRAPWDGLRRRSTGV